MNNNISNSNSIKIVFEVLIVMATVFGVKWVGNYFQITGAGSIGVWGAILVAFLSGRYL